MARSLYEFCARWHISVKKARLMNKEGDLRLSGEETPTDIIRFTLKTSDRRLSVAQLVYLIENPGSVLELGKYAKLANTQIEMLGDPQKQAAPAEVTAQMLDAYQDDPEAVEAIAKWIYSIIPSEPVTHAYIAVRLMLGVPEKIRQYGFSQIQRIFLHCRKHPILAGQWFTVKEKSRNVTFYQKKELDL